MRVRVGGRGAEKPVHQGPAKASSASLKKLKERLSDEGKGHGVVQSQDVLGVLHHQEGSGIHLEGKEMLWRKLAGER